MSSLNLKVSKSSFSVVEFSSAASEGVSLEMTSFSALFSVPHPMLKIKIEPIKMLATNLM